MNKLKKLSAFALGLVMLPQLSHGQGSLLWSNTTYQNFGAYTVFSQAEFWFGVTSTRNDPTQLLFDQISFDTSAVGSTFTISSSADDPDFNAVINALTNGVDQTVVFYLGGNNRSGSGPAELESQLFAGVGAGPDLTGYEIQSFSLQINSLTIQSPGSNPNGDGNWTDFNGQVTLDIYGSPVPEPSSLLLILLGSGVPIYVRRIYKQH